MTSPSPHTIHSTCKERKVQRISDLPKVRGRNVGTRALTVLLHGVLAAPKQTRGFQIYFN